MPTMPRPTTDEANRAAVEADQPSSTDWRHRLLGQTSAQALAEAPTVRNLIVAAQPGLAGAAAARARDLGLSRTAYIRHLILADCRSAGMDLDDDLIHPPRRQRRA